jgi:hypothetical protein
MEKFHIGSFGIFSLLVVLAILILPASAADGTISIAYRGSGGSYLGDAIIFDGYNSVGNATLLKITGPDLPAEGVPVYDMNGQPGAGNTVMSNDDGTWKFVWYTGTIKGLEKLQTARYYITAFDLSDPAKSATASILLKRPEFYVQADPDTATFGDYIQLTGSAEKGSSTVHFNIADSSGKMVHSYDSTVSGSGYFNHGFHVDMPPGVYTITLSSPSVKTTYRNYLTIVADRSVMHASTDVTGTPAPVSSLPGIPISSGTISPSGGAGSLSISSSPSGATVFVDSVMAGTTPLDLVDVTAGNHLVEVKAPGYVTTTVQVSVKPGETISISPVLSKNSSATPLSPFTLFISLLITLAVIAGTRHR